MIRDERDRFSDQSELCSYRFQRCIDESKSFNHEGSVFGHDRPQLRRARHSYSRRRPGSNHGEHSAKRSTNSRSSEQCTPRRTVRRGEVVESQDVTALSLCPTRNRHRCCGRPGQASSWGDVQIATPASSGLTTAIFTEDPAAKRFALTSEDFPSRTPRVSS